MLGATTVHHDSLYHVHDNRPVHILSTQFNSKVAVKFFCVIAYNVVFQVNSISSQTSYSAAVAFGDLSHHNIVHQSREIVVAVRLLCQYTDHEESNGESLKQRIE
jgi:hypothetical protein